MTDRLLLLEALAAPDDSESSWEAFAHDLAALHRSTVHEGFGWAHDGYLGRVVQRNPWTATGQAQKELFRQRRPLVRHRVLRADERYAAVEAFLAQFDDGCRAAHAAADDHQPRLSHRPMST